MAAVIESIGTSLGGDAIVRLTRPDGASGPAQFTLRNPPKDRPLSGLVGCHIEENGSQFLIAKTPVFERISYTEIRLLPKPRVTKPRR